MYYMRETLWRVKKNFTVPGTGVSCYVESTQMEIDMKRLLTLTIAITGMAVHPALAKGGHDHGHGHDKYHGEHERYGDHDRDNVTINIRLNDREYIRHYLSDSYHTNCPPGLAKKHNGCLPPGHAKRYTIGRPLPAGVYYEPLPPELLMRLEPVPYGYQYVRVDQDVLLIGEATKHVVDAVTLLSAVGR